MGFINEWHISYHERVSAANEWVMWYVSRVDKPISKCNPCYNLFITYHIQGIVRMYQWVRNAILACLMITYDTVNGLFCAMHVRPSILFTLRLRCFLNILWWLYIGSQCERVPGNGWLFIESMWCLLNNLPRVLQWSQIMTLKQDISWFIFADISSKIVF